MLSVEKYLARIGFAGAPDRSAETLAKLQTAHLCSVPYETLDVVRKTAFTLEVPDVYDKVVNRGRGGYCFELNGLFAWLLRELGFPVTEYFGRFLRDRDASVPMRRHRVLRVRALESEASGIDYICDVGVGGVCPIRPLRLIPEEPQSDGRYTWRLVRRDFYGWVIQQAKRDGWEDYYSFTEEPQAPVDYVAADFYCRYSPDSAFNKTPICAIQTPGGRRTLREGVFRVFDENGVESHTPEGEAAFIQALRDYFGIVLD